MGRNGAKASDSRWGGAVTNLASGAFPEHDGKGVHVGLFGVALVRQHFGCHPLEGAQAARERVQVVHHSRQPKVGHSHAQRLVHQQVAYTGIPHPLLTL